jgi:hypothetical protein
MEETYGMEKPNGGGGVFVEVTEGDETERLNGDRRDKGIHRGRKEEEESLYGVFRRLISDIFFPDGEQRGRASLLHRIKASVAENGPLLREASGNTGRKVLLWTRRGSPLRALLVISVSISVLVFYLYLVLLLLGPHVLLIVTMCRSISDTCFPFSFFFKV